MIVHNARPVIINIMPVSMVKNSWVHRCSWSSSCSTQPELGALVDLTRFANTITENRYLDHQMYRRFAHGQGQPRLKDMMSSCLDDKCKRTVSPYEFEIRWQHFIYTNHRVYINYILSIWINSVLHIYVLLPNIL
jgi:hypothetical protein